MSNNQEMTTQIAIMAAGGDGMYIFHAVLTGDDIQAEVPRRLNSRRDIPLVIERWHRSGGVMVCSFSDAGDTSSMTYIAISGALLAQETMPNVITLAQQVAEKAKEKLVK